MTTPPRPDQQTRLSGGLPLSPTGLSGNTLLQGIPPAVPMITTKAQTFKGPGTYTLHTMQAAGRVWFASVSATYSANAGYGGATDNEDVVIQMQSGVILALTELVVTTAGMFSVQQSDVPWNGIPIAAGDVLQLVVSSAPTGTVLRASGFVAYSIP